MDLWPLVAPGWNKPAIWPSAQCHQWLSNVAITMSCLPPMTGNGTNTNFKNCDDWEMVYCCFTHIILIQHIYIWFESHELHRHYPTHHHCSCHLHHLSRPAKTRSLLASKLKAMAVLSSGRQEKTSWEWLQVVETLLETTETSNNWKADLSKQTVRVIHPLGILLVTWIIWTTCSKFFTGSLSLVVGFPVDSMNSQQAFPKIAHWVVANVSGVDEGMVYTQIR